MARKIVRKSNKETAKKKIVNKISDETIKKVGKFVYWTPRIVSIVFILFLMLFSLDIFGNGYTFWETVVGLFMHNIPALLLAVVLMLSWKREWVGGIIFILAGLLYIISLFFSSTFEWYMLSWSVLIAGPAFFIGILFLIGLRRKQRSR